MQHIPGSKLSSTHLKKQTDLRHHDEYQNKMISEAPISQNVRFDGNFECANIE
jgi:hypothetical protein